MAARVEMDAAHELAQSRSEVEVLRAELEHTKVNAEQRAVLLEQRLLESQKKLDVGRNECTELEKKLQDSDRKCQEMESKCHSQEEVEKLASSMKGKLEQTVVELEKEKRDLITALEKRERDAEQLNGEWKLLSEKLSASLVARGQLQGRLDELQGSELTTKLREQRLERENNLLENQRSWLDKEFQRTSDDLAKLRREHAQQGLDLRGKLDSLTQEKENMEETMKTLKEQHEEQCKRLEDALQKLKEQRDVQASTEEQFRKELAAQAKLMALYKSAADDAEQKSTELMRGVEELHTVLRVAGKAQSEAEGKLLEVEEKSKLEIDELKSQLTAVQTEIAHSNRLLASATRRGVELTEEELVSLSPAAASASRFIRSGMTLTQIYSAYMETGEALATEREQSASLRASLEGVLAEVQTNAPMLQRQRKDYEQALRSTAGLSSRLGAAMQEIEKLGADLEKSRREVVLSNREKQRLQLQTVDLGQQVRRLLRELSEVSGDHGMRDASEVEKEAELSSDNVSSSSEVISKHLVSFGSIAELQAQNQRLLGVVRDLSLARESEEDRVLDSRITELKAELEKALESIGELKDARAKQTQLVDSLVRQRDMYRVLLQTAGGAIPRLEKETEAQIHSGQDGETIAPGHSSVGGLAASEKAAIEAKAALAQMREEMERVRTEVKDNEREKQDIIDSLQQKLGQLRTENTRVSSQLEFATKRQEIMQTNLESYRKELSTLRDRTSKMSLSCQKQEEAVISLTSDLTTANEKLNRVQVQADGLRQERDMLRSVETRLCKEREAILVEKSAQASLLTNLSLIQLNLERAEVGDKQRLESRLEKQDAELNKLRQRLQEEEETRREAVRNAEAQTSELRKLLAAESASHATVREQLREASTSASALRTKLAETEARLASASRPPTSVENQDDDGEAGELLVSLQEARQLETSLRARLEQSAESMRQLRSMCSDLEEALSQEKQASDATRQALERATEEMHEMAKRLQQALSDADKEKEAIAEERRIEQQLAHNTINSLRTSSDSLRQQLQEAFESSTQATSRERAAQQECQQQAREATEAQERYQRELILHAADVEALSAARAQLSQAGEAAHKAAGEAEGIQIKMEAHSSTWTTQERILKEENQRASARADDLETQNVLLHTQLESLGAQLISLQESDRVSVTAADPTTPEQLLEILRFVRREKDIMEARGELARAEALRVQQRLEQVENELVVTRTALSTERETTQGEMQSPAQHEDLMRKLETLAVVTDSNRLLREEREGLIQKLKQTTARAERLEGELAPLQQSNRELCERNGQMQAEKRTAEDEIKRWKNRVQIANQAVRTGEAEEVKRLQSERDSIRQRQQQLVEDVARLKAENARLSATQAVAQTTAEASRTEREALQHEVAEKGRMVNQVKKIGRRYKSQYEELKLQYDQLLASQASAADRTAQAVSSQANLVTSETHSPIPTTSDSTSQQEGVRLQELQTNLDAVQQSLAAREVELAAERQTGEQLRAEVFARSDTEEQLRQQLGEKEEKAKKLLLSAKQKITQLSAARDQLSQEVEEQRNRANALQHQLEDLQARVANLRSQNLRLEHELRSAPPLKAREGSPDGSKATETSRTTDQQRAIKPTSAGERAGTSADPPMMNIKPTVGPGTGGKATPRASIRPMITPGTSTGTPTATVMPMESPEAFQPDQPPPDQSPVLRSASGVVRSTSPVVTPPISAAPAPSPSPSSSGGPSPSPSVSTTLPPPPPSPAATSSSSSSAASSVPGPTLSLQLPTLVKVFVQPTQQTPPLLPPTEAAGLDPSVQPGLSNMQLLPGSDSGSAVVVSGTDVERPGSSGVVFGAGKRPREEAEPGTSSTTTEPDSQQAKRPRSQEDVLRAGSSDTTVDTGMSPSSAQQEVSGRPHTVVLEGDGEREADDGTEESNREFEADEVNPSFQSVLTDVIVIDSENEDRDGQGVCLQFDDDDDDDDDDDGEGRDVDIADQDDEQEEEEEDEVMDEDSQDQIEAVGDDDEDDDEDDEDDEEEEDEAEEEEEEEEEVEQVEGECDLPGEARRSRPEDDSTIDVPGEAQAAQSVGYEDSEEVEDGHNSGYSRGERHVGYPPSHRRPSPILPPRLTIYPPATEHPAPHVQRGSFRRPSMGGRGGPVTPGIGTAASFLFEDDDSMVPSTPTLPVPHRTDDFAQAINSPQVARMPRFQFGPPEELSASTSGQSDLRQLASQGGLGMYETPICLQPASEDDGGRSVPTTPLQPTAPACVFEGLVEQTENPSQSVPVATGATAPDTSSTHDLEADPDSSGQGQMDMETLEGVDEGEGEGMQDDAPVPSTSQDTPIASSSRGPRGRAARSARGIRVARGGRTERGGGAVQVRRPICLPVSSSPSTGLRVTRRRGPTSGRRRAL
uniref:nucleoprotein TPR isoform X2 n=1 Tax=Myxine glutinosa TaxID=7769 RepID=UPI00358F2151